MKPQRREEIVSRTQQYRSMRIKIARLKLDNAKLRQHLAAARAECARLSGKKRKLAMSDARQQIREAIYEASGRIHNSQDWEDPYYGQPTVMEMLVSRIEEIIDQVLQEDNDDRGYWENTSNDL